MEGNKHYIRLDKNNNIIKGCSDAFEQPLETDICINENGGRHFEMNGQINPPLISRDGKYLYSYIDNIILENDVSETIAELKDKKYKELSQACNAHINAGFDYNQLHYQFDDKDQMNFTQQMLINDKTNPTHVTWESGLQDGNFKTYTAKEWDQIAIAAQNHKSDAITKIASLRTQLADAATKKEVEAITW